MLVPPVTGNAFSRMGRPYPAIPSAGLLRPDAQLPVKPFNATDAASQFVKLLDQGIQMEDSDLKTVLRQVNQQQALAPFTQAVQTIYAANGKGFQTPFAALEAHYGKGSRIKWFFNKAAFNEMSDALLGKSALDDTRAERRLGFYRFGEQFVSAFVAHPVASTIAVIGVTAAGTVWPFVAALYGGSTIVLGGVSLAQNEWKAHHDNPSVVQKNTYHQASGESIATLVTGLIGVDEMFKNFQQGARMFSKSFAAPSSAGILKRLLVSTKNTVFNRQTLGKHKIGGLDLLTNFRLVAGLLDDALLPINAVAAKIKDYNRQSHPPGTLA